MAENPPLETPKCAQDNLGIMKLNDHKAGMQGLDTVKINQIIEEASKGSKFYQHKQKNQERINTKIAEMKLANSKLTEDQKRIARAKVTQFKVYFCFLIVVNFGNLIITDGQLGPKVGANKRFNPNNSPCGHGRLLCSRGDEGFTRFKVHSMLILILKYILTS